MSYNKEEITVCFGTSTDLSIEETKQDLESSNDSSEDSSENSGEDSSEDSHYFSISSDSSDSSESDESNSEGNLVDRYQALCEETRRAEEELIAQMDNMLQHEIMGPYLKAMMKVKDELDGDDLHDFCVNEVEKELNK